MQNDAQIFNAYQHLQSLAPIEDIFCQIFKILSEFIKRYTSLACLMTTSIFMSVHCTHIVKNKDQTKHFIKLINMWLQKINCGSNRIMSEVLYIPTSEIRLFLEDQDSSSEEVLAYYITELYTTVSIITRTATKSKETPG